MFSHVFCDGVNTWCVYCQNSNVGIHDDQPADSLGDLGLFPGFFIQPPPKETCERFHVQIQGTIE